MPRCCIPVRAALTTLVLLALSGSVSGQTAGKAAVIWLDRGDIASLDLLAGPGGEERAPGTDLTFLKESKGGTSPKFDVEDEHGTKWKVKLGEEAQSETAATRLLWAAGYVVDEDYYRPLLRVRGLTRLARGQEFVSNGDTVIGARLERDTESHDSRTWSWYDNPFVGTREFNGLRVMMALVNNWDLKAVNNDAAATLTGEEQYGIGDLGATFGRTGNSLTRSKAVVKDFEDARFIEKVTATDVDFGMHTRPFFLSIFNFPNYLFRTRMESVVKHIPLGDALWIGDRLGQLSSAQIADCFRAAGFSPAEVDAYAQVVTQRIAALRALGRAEATPGAEPGEAGAPTRQCATSTCRQVPLRETLTAITLGTPYAHAIVGGFEQGAGIGGGVQVTSASAFPAVELRAAGLTTTHGDRRFDLEALFPALGASRNHADAWFSYLQRDTDFYGIGPRTSESQKSEFGIERLSGQGSVYRDLSDHAQGGVYAQVMEAHASFAGQRNTSQILSFGTFLSYDTRDNSNGLTRGLNLFGRVASADGVGRQDGDARYGWMEAEFDARAYAPVGSHRTSLLLRSRGQFKTPTGGHDIPYYDLSWLGGRQYLRGYHSYRFRDNNVLLVSSELQQTVYARTSVRGMDLFASADAGQVWGTDPFDARDWASGVGGGLQYRHSRSAAARVEAARSLEGVAWYVSFSRGF